MKNKQIRVDEQPLIFFHFNGLKKLVFHLYDSGFAGYQAKFPNMVRDNIYLPYIKILEEDGNTSPSIIDDIVSTSIRSRTKHDRFQKSLPRLFNLLRICRRIPKIIYTKTYIYAPKKRFSTI